MIFQLLNNQIHKVDRIIEPDYSVVTVYEVMRIIEGIPLFFSDHFSRLLKSSQLVNRIVEMEEEAIFSQLCSLVKLSQVDTGNLMLKVYYHENDYEWSAFMIPHSYPDKMDYIKGVEVGLLKAERSNPEAKVENKIVRGKANEIILKGGFYEVLLVNSTNELTEGSRSNLFGIKGNQLYTAPLDLVLSGITLLKTIEIIKTEKLNLNFNCILLNELSDYDALFLTGTSPKVLPIAKIGEHRFDTQNRVLQNIITQYNQLIAEDIQKKKGFR